MAQQIAMAVLSESQPEAASEEAPPPNGAVELGVLPVHLQRLILLAESWSIQLASLECPIKQRNMKFAIDVLERVVNFSTQEHLPAPPGNFSRMMLGNNWTIYAIPGPSRDAARAH